MSKGLPRRHLRPMVLAFLVLASAAGAVASAGPSAVLYSTDFSSNPGWVTNSPYSNHWDEAKGTLHYFLRDSTNTFLYKKIPYAGESFRLEFDLFPLRTDFQSSFRLGLGGREMYVNQGTTILSEFENGPYGKIMWLRVIDQSNQRREVSSYGQSYGGPSVRFSDGTPYHVVIDYDRGQKTAGIAISFLGNGTPAWGYTLSGITNLGPMDRIYLSTIGDFENPSAAAEGDIDNLSMSLLFPSPPTPRDTPPPALTMNGEAGTATVTTAATRPTAYTVPVFTTKSTPVPLLIALSALALAALLVLGRK